MSKELTPSTKEQPAKSAAVVRKIQPEQLALDEFCARLSENEKRYTLIAGFHSGEIKARRLRDTASAYEARFAAFINQPA